MSGKKRLVHKEASWAAGQRECGWLGAEPQGGHEEWRKVLVWGLRGDEAIHRGGCDKGVKQASFCV